MNLEVLRIIGLVGLGLAGIVCLIWVELDNRKVDECKRKSAEMTEQARTSMPVSEGK